MPPSTKDNKLEKVAALLLGSIQGVIQNRSSLEFSKDPQMLEKDIIEYESRLRTFGLEKFNGPCYLVSVSFYLSAQALKEEDAYGTLVFYIEEEATPKFLKAIGSGVKDDDDEELILDNLAGIVESIIEDFKNKLTAQNYPNLIQGEPLKTKNDVFEGVPFPYSQSKYYELSFYLWKNKALVADVTMLTV